MLILIWINFVRPIVFRQLCASSEEPCRMVKCIKLYYLVQNLPVKPITKLTSP